MGGGASIEGPKTLNLDYSALKSSGIDFAAAYKAIENKVRKGKSANAGDVSIPFLALRQLSKNLHNQESLERTKRKVLKSRSLPNNIKFRTASIEQVEDETVEDELNQTDLALVPEPDLGLGFEEKVKSKKPNLSLQVSESFTGDVTSEQPTVSPNSSTMRISPSGALHVGKLKILETGIHQDKLSSFRDLDHFSRSINEKTTLPAIPGGKKEFLEIATLGMGASGVVSEAIHLPTLTIVALKMLPIYNQEKRRHVSRELAILYKNLADMHLINNTLDSQNRNGNKQRCDNILSLYNAFIDPKSGLINLVIEYMDGGSLEDLVRQGGCKDEQVLADIARQTLNGLSFLHFNKSVHRDIKPANILCSSNGVIKIADFGISKVLDQSSGFANSFVGTVCYMSPERITGEIYTFSSDIWSFGLTLLAVAKGKFPIQLRDVHDPLDTRSKSKDENDDSPSHQIIGGPKGYWAMIQAICDDEPPTAGDEFSSKFNSLINSCLQKAAENRSSASELLKMPFIVDNIQSPRHPASIFKPGNREIEDDKPEDFHEFDMNDLALHPPSLSTKVLSPEDEQRIIYAIRLEHLDRLIGKIADKLDPSKISKDLSSKVTNTSLSTDSADNLFQSDAKEVDDAASFIHREGKIDGPPHSILKHPHDDDSSTMLNSVIPKSFSIQEKAASSQRSVHFLDEDIGAENKPEPKLGLRSRLNLKLSVAVDDDDDINNKLPKPSSYFLKTGFVNHEIEKIEEESPGTSDKFVSDQISYYKKIIPKFDDEKDLDKWRNLAVQLNLPFQIVYFAVKSRLEERLESVESP